jgi:transcription-repair coupling factor (superfamily II helicase)
MTPRPAEPDNRSDLSVPDRETAAEPDGVVALRLIGWAARASGAVIYVARSDTRAVRLAAAVRGFAPELAVLHLPSWDSLPYERVSPSAQSMGRRMAVLNRLLATSDRRASSTAPLILLTSVEAASQKLPPGSALADSTYRLQPGDELDLPAFEDYLAWAGYAIVEQVENPGEAALRGEVIDLYPPAAECPSRLAHADGRIEDIRRYDSASQRTIGDAGELLLDPASEILLEPGQPRSAGMEQRLPRFYPRLDSIFDYLPEATLATDPEVEERAASWTDQIADAYRYRQIVGRTGAAEPPIPPETLYLSEDEWRSLLDLRERPDLGASDGEAGPNFTDTADPADAARRYLRRCHSGGDRIVLTAGAPRQLRRLARIAPVPAKSVNSWEDSESVDVAALIAPLEAGFRYDGAVVLAAADL